MKDNEKITLTVAQLKKIVKESRQKLSEARNSYGYVYLSDLFYKQPANIPQRSLRKIFKQFESESEELDQAVRDWLKEMINLPKNEWLTPKDAAGFAGVVWDNTGGKRGYASAPALKFRTYEAAEQCAYLLSDYNSKERGWGITRNWIGREYP
jgi:hypothetical protein